MEIRSVSAAQLFMALTKQAAWAGSIKRYPPAECLAAFSRTDFEGRHLAILEGEKAAAAVMTTLKAKLARARAR